MKARTVSLPLQGLYTLASFLHFAHNGVRLDAYPSMPHRITAPGVFATWLPVLALYATSGLDGLAHYGLAPVTAHSFAMNFTIWSEAVTAILLLIGIARMPRVPAVA